MKNLAILVSCRFSILGIGLWCFSSSKVMKSKFPTCISNRYIIFYLKNNILNIVCVPHVSNSRSYKSRRHYAELSIIRDLIQIYRSFRFTHRVASCNRCSLICRLSSTALRSRFLLYHHVWQFDAWLWESRRQYHRTNELYDAERF